VLIDFLVKSLLVFGLVYLFGWLAPNMPLGVFSLWLIALALPMSFYVAHGFAVRRTRLAHTFSQNGLVQKFLARSLGVNVLVFLASLVISFFTLINFALLRGWDWVWVALSFGVFYLAQVLLPKRLVGESVPWLRPARFSAWTLFLAPLLLGLLRAVFLGLSAPGGWLDGAWRLLKSSSNFLAAIAPSGGIGEFVPFGESSSAFLKLAGGYAALVGSIGQQSLDLLESYSWFLGLFFQTLNSVCLYGGCFAVIAFLTMAPGEWRRPLVAPAEVSPPPKVPRSAALWHLAVLALVGLAFFYPRPSLLDNYSSGPKGVALESFRVKLQREMTRFIYALGGRFYDEGLEARVQELAQGKLKAISLKREDLIVRINQDFNGYKSRVDHFLDWYYSLSGELGQLAQLVQGGQEAAERYLREKMAESIAAQSDSQKLYADIKKYVDEVNSFKSELEEDIQIILPLYEVSPEFMVNYKLQRITLAELANKATPVTLTRFPTRAVASAIAGLGAGSVTAVIVAKLAKKIIFKKAVKALVRIAATRGLTVAGGAAVGGAAGSVIPGAGTAAGAVAGLAVGLAAGLGLDKIIIEIEEFMNREEFKREIFKTIDAERMELLRALKPKD
jgi:hypothetical protein